MKHGSVDQAAFWERRLGGDSPYSRDMIQDMTSVLDQCWRGIPESHRGRAWNWLVAAEVQRLTICPPTSSELTRNNRPKYASRSYHQLLDMPEDAPYLLANKIIIDIDKDLGER